MFKTKSTYICGYCGRYHEHRPNFKVICDGRDGLRHKPVITKEQKPDDKRS